MADPEQIRLRAFVGRSFLRADEGLWLEVRTLLESLKPIGFAFEDAQEAQPRAVSEKVRSGIDRNDIYLGILSRRDQIIGQSGVFRFIISSFVDRRQRWSPPPWVVQESGYALGAGKRVVLLIEEGVEFPIANLDADREWVGFKREAVPLIAPRLIALINHLIAERLPALPTGGSQVIAPEPTPTPAEQEEKQDVPDFFGVFDNIRQGNFVDAKSALDRFLRTAAADDPFRAWLPYYYLAQKAIHGDSSSLEELRSVVAKQPGDVEARTQLANYYRHFDKQNEAARILLDGLSAAGPAGRAQLMRSAASAYSEAREYNRSLDVLARLVREAGAVAETFISLADTAKAMGNSDLEVAALERVLAIDPGRSRIRFRLAYAYSESDSKQLAVYHYKVRLSQGPDTGAMNNLGVAYAALKLPGKEIESYLKAADENDLARANLSHAYIDRCFLTTAEGMANAVLAGPPDSSGRDRAAAALRRISTRRTTETEAEEKIEQDARREADLRAAYAEAYVDDAAQLVSGEYQTAHGVLTVQYDGDRLTGSATVREPAPLSLLGSLVPSFVTRMQTRVLTLEGSIHGRAGSFKLRTVVTAESPVPQEDKSEASGLLVIARDGRSFQVLEKGKDSTKIYAAHLVEANSA